MSVGHATLSRQGPAAAHLIVTEETPAATQAPEDTTEEKVGCFRTLGMEERPKTIVVATTVTAAPAQPVQQQPASTCYAAQDKPGKIEMCSCRAKLHVSFRTTYEELLSGTQPGEALSWTASQALLQAAMPAQIAGKQIKHVVLHKVTMYQTLNEGVGTMFLSSDAIPSCCYYENGSKCLYPLLPGAHTFGKLCLHRMSEKACERFGSLIGIMGKTVQDYFADVKPSQEDPDSYIVPRDSLLFEPLKCTYKKVNWDEHASDEQEDAVVIGRPMYETMKKNIESDIRFMNDVMVPASKLKFSLMPPGGVYTSESLMGGVMGNQAAKEFLAKQKHCYAAVLDIQYVAIF